MEFKKLTMYYEVAYHDHEESLSVNIPKHWDDEKIKFLWSDLLGFEFDPAFCRWEISAKE